jgi:hypothetical protein
MAWEEKYGAIWNPPLDEGDVVLEERFLPDLDVVTLVVQRRDGLLAVSVLKKEHDRQWRLPFWGPMEAPALVETIDDAQRFLASTVAMLGGHG